MPRTKTKFFKLGKTLSRDKYNSSSTKKFYNSSRWRKVSKQFRNENPLCQKSLEEGKYVLANVTDHIIPINHGGAKFDLRNLQSLSNSKHNSKSAKEKKLPIYKFTLNEDGDRIPIRSSSGKLIRLID